MTAEGTENAPLVGEMTARALWTIAPRFCELRSEVLPAVTPGKVRVRSLVSGFSGGTESLVFAGKVPMSEFERMRAPFQAGQFPFPVKYGYATVGIVEDGDAEWLGARVFVLHPHQDRFVVPVGALTRLSEAVPTDRAVLSANMETALNAVWDAGLAPGERVAIVGAGIVGSLIAAIAGRMPGVELTLFDTDTERAARAALFGAAFAHVSETPASETDGAGQIDFDCVFHTSGNPGGLVKALEISGVEARIVELSWYGNAPVTLPLGQAFHSHRLSIISSQVGMVAASRRARFDYRRRMSVVQRLLEDPRLDTLIGSKVDFETLPAKIGRVLSQRGGLCQLVRYG